MSAPSSAHYNQRRLQTGDVILFHEQTSCCCNGLVACVSKLVECFTSSKFSHIGIIVTDIAHLGIKDGRRNVSKDEIYVLESNREGDKMCVQLTPLSHFITTFPGTMYVRHLRCNRNQKFYDVMASTWAGASGCPYDTNLIDWLAAWCRQDSIGVWRLSEERKWQNTRRFWCSAIVAYFYVQLGFLQPDTPFTLVSPREFSHFEGKELHFINCTLDAERFLVT